MTAEKFLKIKRSCKLHELRYFQQIIALSEDCKLLFELKCEYIIKETFRYSEGLKVYFYGKDEWLFDFLPTKKQASRIVVESFLSPFVCAMYGCSSMKRFKEVH